MKRFFDMQKIEGVPGDTSAFVENVNNARAEIRSREITLLNPTNIRLEFGKFGAAPDGRFTAENHNVDFDCFFKRNSESDTLYVIFSGSRKPNSTEPTFKRWSYYNYLDGSVLCIDDPMCRLYPALFLGWYYGTEKESYCDYIVEIVKEFAAQNNFKNITFFASSAGGYAALYCACKIPGSTACAINPQIKPSLYHYAPAYQKITGLDLSSEDPFGRNDLPKLLRDSKDTRILLIENSASPGDLRQLNDLCGVLKTNYNYGLSRLAPNILCWVYEAVSDIPHNAQEFVEMVSPIEFLINHFDNAEDYKDIYYMFGELWYSIYRVQNDTKNIRAITHLKSVDEKKYADFQQIEVVSFNNTVIKGKKSDKFNRMIICDKLEPNVLYRLKIENISVLDGETEKYTIGVKDLLSEKVDFLETHSIGSNFSVYFKTGIDAEKKEVRIYAGECGKTNNISLGIGSIRLFKIEI